MEAIDEIVAEFLLESHENLDQLDRDLLALEQHPGSRKLLGHVFAADAESLPADDHTAVDSALEIQRARRSVVASSVRVDVELPASLMHLVGELGLARDQLVSRLGGTTETTKDSSLARSAQRLSMVGVPS